MAADSREAPSTDAASGSQPLTPLPADPVPAPDALPVPLPVAEPQEPSALYFTSEYWADRLTAADDTLTLLLIAVAGAVIAPLLIWLLLILWRLLLKGLGNLALRLWTRWPLRSLALREYRRRVHNTFGKVHNIYLDTEEEVLDLAQVFVPLTLRERADGQKHAGGPLIGDTRSVITAPEQQRLMLLGDPGSGKTTLLKALASGVSQRQWPEFDALVPVYVRLRAYAQADGRPDLWDWIVQQLRSDEFQIRRAEPLLNSLAKDGRLLLLLDGLDEVGEEATRWVPARITVLGERLHTQPGNRLIISCREQNFSLLEDPGLFPRHGFAVYRLAEMRDAEMEAMVAKRQPWFDEQGKDPSRFLGQVRAAPNVEDLHRNPLLLTLSIGLYLRRVDERVPNDLAEFYDQGLDNLLRRHDFRGADNERQGVERRNRFNHKHKLKLLQRFALDSLRRATSQSEDFEVWRVRELIATARDEVGNLIDISRDEADPLIREIRDNAGLIKDTGDADHYFFAHRSLHEFCAARRLATQGEVGYQLALKNADEPDWFQVLIFYASLDHDNAARLVQQLLETGRQTRIRRLALAGQCAAVLAHPLVDLRVRVAEALDEALGREGDEQAVRLLLDALIRMSRGAAEPVRARVEETVRTLLNADRPDQVARELWRLDRKTALAIIDLLIASGEPERLRGALSGLEVMEGIEHVPTLWRLIGQLAEKDGLAEELQRAVAGMVYLLANPQAADRLQAQPALRAHQLSQTRLDQVFPFTAQSRAPGNIAEVLALAAPNASSITDFTDPHDADLDPWGHLFSAAVAPKDRRRQLAWKRVARDHLRRQWRLPRRTVAEVALATLLAAGLTQIVLFVLHRPGFVGDSWHGSGGLPVGIPLGFVFLWAVLFPFLVDLWIILAKRLGWWSGSDGFCAGKIQRWVGLRPLSTRSIGILPCLRRRSEYSHKNQSALLNQLGITVGTMLLFPLALFLNHPNPAGQLWPASGIAVDRTGSVIVAPSPVGPPLILDADTGTQLDELRPNVRFDTNRAMVSEDGQSALILAGTALVVRDLRSGRTVRQDAHELEQAEGASATNAAVAAYAPVAGLDSSSGEIPAISFADPAWQDQQAIGLLGDEPEELSLVESLMPLVAFGAISVNSRLVATARNQLTKGRQQTIEVWQRGTGKRLGSLQRLHMPLDALALSPDGRCLLFGGLDVEGDQSGPVVYAWDIDRNLIRRVIDFDFDFTDFEVPGLEYSPGGRSLLIRRGESVHALDMATWAEIGFARAPDGAAITDAAFSPDTTTIAFAAGSSVFLWAFKSDAEPRQIEQDSTTDRLAWTPSGDHLILNATDGTLSMIDADSGDPVWSLSSHYAHPGNIGFDDLAVFLALVVLFVFFPTTKFFDPGKWFYLWPLRPNPYLYLYDLPGIEHYIPVDPRRRGKRASGTDAAAAKPADQG